MKTYDAEKLAKLGYGTNGPHVELTKDEVRELASAVGGSVKEIESTVVRFRSVSCYGIRGGTIHASVRAALRANAKREGEGWGVWDSDGVRWVMGADGEPINTYD